MGLVSWLFGKKDATSGLSEDSKKKIYAELMTMATDMALNCASDDEDVAKAAKTHGRSVNLAQAMIQSMEGNFARSLEKSYAKIGAKYGLSKAVLKHIYDEGQKKSWKQR